MDICADCGKHIEIGDWPFACAGLGHSLKGTFWTGGAQIRQSEKVVVYRGPGGDVKIPGRADRPLHPKLKAAGYVRETLDTVSDVRRIERETGLIHEASNYDSGSATAEKDTGSV
jgi:hypothetical protein